MRYLVVGRAKTGTTVISKTIQNTLGLKNYWLEPKVISLFEDLGKGNSDGVVKILFEQWSARPRLLNAIIYNELGTNFVENVFIVRDPRAELVSRIHYHAFGHFQKEVVGKGVKEKWLEIFRRKEAEPAKVSLRDIVSYLNDNFDVLGEANLKFISRSATVYARYVKSVVENRKTIVRYEDFVSGKLSNSPLFSGSRDVGADLQRTNRSGGVDDWSAFILDEDIEWVNDMFGSTIPDLGYDPKHVPERQPIHPQTCTDYLSRIIDEAQVYAKKAR